MGAHVIVWDLETVPDLSAFAAAKALDGRPETEIRQALGEKFPKLICHSVVCIGALIAERRDSSWYVLAVGAPNVGERTEKQLREDFVARIGELQPQLLTYNGNSFDLPVLRYRVWCIRLPHQD